MKNYQQIKIQKKMKRKKRVRAKIRGTAQRPRLCVYKSLKYIYTQIIDDDKSKTLTAARSQEVKSKKTEKKEIAFQLGKLIAQKANKLNIKEVVFDRAGYKYHGIIKSLAEGAREGGLKF